MWWLSASAHLIPDLNVCSAIPADFTINQSPPNTHRPLSLQNGSTETH